MSESVDITAEHSRLAAQIASDVGVERIADVYAKALLGATERSGETEAVLDEFDAVLRDVFDRFPKLEAVLGSGLVLPEEKVDVIDRVFRGRACPTLVNFLKVVARHGRLDCLRAIHRQARAALERLRRRVPVRLTTAVPVEASRVRQIAERLAGRLEGSPVIEQEVDPGLIGGAVLRIGDVVYDGSIANQLKLLRQKMSARSTHEIQSRRDRFRHSAGN